tara:strand:- start:62254 stop:62418 length:165 start_codon:yes stop_codon:yes gene_type:complete
MVVVGVRDESDVSPPEDREVKSREIASVTCKVAEVDATDTSFTELMKVTSPISV